MAPSYLPYEEKLQRLYGTLREPVLLKKDWARELPGLGRVPRFVGEFLLAAGVGRGRALVEVVDELNRLHPPPGEHGRFRHRLVVEGELTLLDFLDVQVDTETGLHLTALPSLRLQPVEVPAELAMQHPGLVSGGLWGRVSLSWDPRRRAARLPPTYVTAFRPVQVSVSLDTFLEGRAYLTTAECVHVLLASAGYDPRGVVQGLESEAAVRRRKLLLLTRLCPLVEGNLNLVEFGPKNTGKTYLLRSLTPRAYVVSGGRATAATLFEHLGNGRLGLLATRRVVVFDEIARLRFGSPEIVGIL